MTTAHYVYLNGNHPFMRGYTFVELPIQRTARQQTLIQAETQRVNDMSAGTNSTLGM